MFSCVFPLSFFRTYVYTEKNGSDVPYYNKKELFPYTILIVA